jgi:hypothetical protein
MQEFMATEYFDETSRRNAFSKSGVTVPPISDERLPLARTCSRYFISLPPAGRLDRFLSVVI